MLSFCSPKKGGPPFAESLLMLPMGFPAMLVNVRGELPGLGCKYRGGFCPP